MLKLGDEYLGFVILFCAFCTCSNFSKSKGFIKGGSEVKASAWNAGDQGSIPGSGRSPGEGNGKPLQYSCLENPKNGGAWWAAVHGVAKSRTRLSEFTFTEVNYEGLQLKPGRLLFVEV